MRKIAKTAVLVMLTAVILFNNGTYINIHSLESVIITPNLYNIDPPYTG